MELLFSDGTCFSSSYLDGGTRFKKIDLKPGRWRRVAVRLNGPVQETALRAWCEERIGREYDWLGIIGFALPGRIQDSGKCYCSEVCAAGLREVLRAFEYSELPRKISPAGLLRRILRK